jgi:hypothetical protein
MGGPSRVDDLLDASELAGAEWDPLRIDEGVELELDEQMCELDFPVAVDDHDIRLYVAQLVQQRALVQAAATSARSDSDSMSRRRPASTAGAHPEGRRGSSWPSLSRFGPSPRWGGDRSLHRLWSQPRLEGMRRERPGTALGRVHQL